LNRKNIVEMHLRFVLLVFTLQIFNGMQAQINPSAEIKTLLFSENGNFPNNPDLPVLLYKNVFDFSKSDPAADIERIFSQNNWGGSWRNGIYNFQHYHSTAHEALGVYSGWAVVQLGGPENDPVKIEKGDLVVLPAGTAHKRIDSGGGFAVVGAYPDSQSWDMNYGKADETKNARQNISRVPLPTNDPVLGKNGKMFEYWK
jgi:uncharacterized protein YjlB